jgi:DNA-binding HxlR family transcriptional regulator
MTRQEQEIVQAIKDGFNTTGEIKRRLKLCQSPSLNNLEKKGIVARDGFKSVDVGRDMGWGRMKKVIVWKLVS